MASKLYPDTKSVWRPICVMSDHLTSKAGTITSGEDRFME